MSRWIEIFMALFFPMLALAHVDSCVCETGTSPVEQTPFFKIGCEAWLATQWDCGTKYVTSEDFDYTRWTEIGRVKSVRIGYVGHWSSSQETVKYLEQRIHPILNRGISVEFDNTACLAMQKPEMVQNYVNQLKLRPNQHLEVRGNQTVSVGEWALALGNTENFYAKATSSSKEVRYPYCDNYKGQLCIGEVQRGQSASCLDQQRHLKTLTCCRSGSVGLLEFNEDLYTWEPKENCH